VEVGDTQIDNTSMALDAILEAVAERAARKVLESQAEARPVTPALDFDRHGIEPLRVYSVKETAHFLGTNRLASVYTIDKERLPRANGVGSAVGFLGIHILCYMADLPPVDIRSAVQDFRERLLNDRRALRAVDLDKSNLVRVH
jgi:hypothetical protein